MGYYGVEDGIPVEVRPGLVLSAEQELGITAGLQDRVIQVYGGLVYMDFDKQYMEEHGHGQYIPLDPSLLPPLYLMYSNDPSDSGKVHSTVKQRWLQGDPQIRRGMEEVASLAEEGRVALESRQYSRLAELMNRNFDLRRSMFGDEVLGDMNLQMINLARSHRCAAKFTGSGGAIVIYCPDGEVQAEKLAEDAATEGFTLVPVEVGPAKGQVGHS